MIFLPQGRVHRGGLLLKVSGFLIQIPTQHIGVGRNCIWFTQNPDNTLKSFRFSDHTRINFIEYYLFGSRIRRNIQNNIISRVLQFWTGYGYSPIMLILIPAELKIVAYQILLWAERYKESDQL